MKCPCCGEPFGVQRRSPLVNGYCSVVCFAAASILSREALRLWREECWRLASARTFP